MLVIRESQMAALTRSLDEPFVRWLASDLRTTTPERTAALDDAALRELVHDALAHARRAGLTGSTALAEFASLYLALGKAIETHRCFGELRRAGRNAESLFTAQLVRREWL